MVLGPDHHFADKPAKIKEIFDRVVAIVESNGQVQTSFVKNAIIISAKSSFLALKPKKASLQLEFLVKEEIDEFPIYKIVRVSKNKVAHFVRIGEPEEVDNVLKNWLVRALNENIS